MNPGSVIWESKCSHWCHELVLGLPLVLPLLTASPNQSAVLSDPYGKGKVFCPAGVFDRDSDSCGTRPGKDLVTQQQRRTGPLLGSGIDIGSKYLLSSLSVAFLSAHLTLRCWWFFSFVLSGATWLLSAEAIVWGFMRNHASL